MRKTIPLKARAGPMAPKEFPRISAVNPALQKPRVNDIIGAGDDRYLRKTNIAKLEARANKPVPTYGTEGVFGNRRYFWTVSDSPTCSLS